MSLPVKRYAEALFGAARDAGEVDAVAADLEAMHRVLADGGVRAVLGNPVAPNDLKRSVLDKLAEGRHELVRSFCRVLLKRRREDLLPDVWPVFRVLLQASRGEADGVVETPRSLGEDELDQLAALAGRLSGKKVTLTVRRAPELLGGVRLRVGNTLYDGSVHNAIQQLERQLLSAPLETGPQKPA